MSAFGPARESGGKTGLPRSSSLVRDAHLVSVVPTACSGAIAGAFIGVLRTVWRWQCADRIVLAVGVETIDKKITIVVDFVTAVELVGWW